MSRRLFPNTKQNAFVPVDGTALTLPVTIICGGAPGKTALVTAGIHSREYVGVETARLLAATLDPAQVRGTVVLVHACNYAGFLAHSNDVMPQDGRNLNHAFPGSPSGSSAERLADFLCREFLSRSDLVIDLHSGGYNEDLIPHGYYQATADPAVCAASRELGCFADHAWLVQVTATRGLFSYAPVLGVPAVLLERGGRGLWSREEVHAMAADVRNILRHADLLCDGVAPVRHAPKVIQNAFYVPAPSDGCWYPARQPGARIARGEVLGTLRDIFGTPLHVLYAEASGVLLYQAASLSVKAGATIAAYGEIED